MKDKMKEWVNISISKLESYVGSFTGLTENQKRNFEIKKEHSLRVADLSLFLAEKLEFTNEQCHAAYLAGLLHDIGRFQQLIEYNTFNDEKSVDHAELAIKIVEDGFFLDNIDNASRNLVLAAINNHNKYKIQDGLSEPEMAFAKLLRDADKIDILKVLSEYYSKRNTTPNHILTWDLPKGSTVSANVTKEVLSEKLVSKKNVVSELDVKVMQLSWVFDINYRSAIEYLLKNRYLENIYNALPKNDLVFDIYRKIKVFAENRIMVK